jgi:YegS/Rv2252/BmrU family lipid kinase
MTVKVILNPYADRWGAKERLHSVIAALEAMGVAYDLAVTEAPRHGIALAQEAVEAGYEAVIAAGGDGTINEVLNGIMAATPADAPTPPFGIIPLGSANDFYRMAGLPLDLVACAEVIGAGRTRQVDGGMVNGRCFLNNAAVAMEPMVTLENIRMRRLKGEIRYLAALVRAIIKLSAWRMTIEWDGGGYTGPAYLLSVCNSPRTGGFQMAPGACIDDGLFDFVFAPAVPKGTVLAVLLRLLRGTHIHHPAVTFGRTARLSLTSRPGTPIHADGEVFAEEETAVTYQVLPGKVTLITP